MPATFLHTIRMRRIQQQRAGADRERNDAQPRREIGPDPRRQFPDYLWKPEYAAVKTGYFTEVYQRQQPGRSEEHTSELQSLMRISYAVFCLKKKKKRRITQISNDSQITILNLSPYYEVNNRIQNIKKEK